MNEWVDGWMDGRTDGANLVGTARVFGRPKNALSLRFSACNTSSGSGFSWRLLLVLLPFVDILLQQFGWYCAITDIFHAFCAHVDRKVSNKNCMFNTFSVTFGDKGGRRRQVICLCLSTAVFWRSISLLLIIMVFYLERSVFWLRAQHCTGTSVRELARIVLIAGRTTGVTHEAWIVQFHGLFSIAVIVHLPIWH